MNLRPADWDEETIGNFLGQHEADDEPPRPPQRRGPRRGRSPARRRETRRRGPGSRLIAALRRTRLLPLWAKQSRTVLLPATSNRGVDAAIVCSLGAVDDVLRFGSDAGDVLELWFFTPTKSPLSVCIGAAFLDRRLHLTLRYPLRLFSADAARRFADCYADHLRAVANSRRPR